MSDCLKNEDTLVSDLASSNVDNLTGMLNPADVVNSEINNGSSINSLLSGGYETTSTVAEDSPVTSELGTGEGGGVKYTGQNSDNIEINVDNNVNSISATLKRIKFDSVADFPKTGSEKLIYVDFSNKALYGWDSTKGVYYKLVADVKVPTKLSEFTNDAGFITNTVNNLVEYYKKTETYTQEEIDSKISAIPKFAIKVVTELPTTDISETTVYLVASGSDNQNLYIEYIYVDGVWEKLGEQTLDLSNVVNSINGKTGEVQLTAEDVGALPSDTPLFSGNYNDLTNKPTQYNGSIYYYGTSSTDANTDIKIVECPDFKLVNGVKIAVHFTYANGTNSTKLNINNTGAIDVIYCRANGASYVIPNGWWRNGSIVEFIYKDGWYYVVSNMADANNYGYTRLAHSLSDVNRDYALSQKAGQEIDNRLKALENAGGTKVIWEVWE